MVVSTMSTFHKIWVFGSGSLTLAISQSDAKAVNLHVCKMRKTWNRIQPLKRNKMSLSRLTVTRTMWFLTAWESEAKRRCHIYPSLNPNQCHTVVFCIVLHRWHLPFPLQSGQHMYKSQNGQMRETNGQIRTICAPFMTLTVMLKSSLAEDLNRTNILG